MGARCRRTAVSVLTVGVVALGGPAVVPAGAVVPPSPATIGQPASAPVGADPLGVAVDAATDTVYVANSSSGTVSVLNGATCNGTLSTGCTPVATATVGTGPGAVAVDQATDTVYVANTGSGTVSVIDGSTCDAASSTNCTPVATATVGSDPWALADDSGAALYVANAGSGTVSVIDEATCDAQTATDCTPVATPTVGSAPEGVAVDQSTGSVYVANAGSASVSVLDAATCGATSVSGCTPVGTSSVAGDPQGVAVDPATDTVYVAQYGKNPSGSVSGSATALGGGEVAVLNGATCGATVDSGCAPVAHAWLGGEPVDVAVDQGTDTVYASTPATAHPSVSVIDGATCDATSTAGCVYTWGVPVGSDPQGLAVDPSSATSPDSVYVADAGSDAVSVLGQPAALSGVTASAGSGEVTVSWTPSTAFLEAAAYYHGLPDVPGELSYQVVPSPACASCTGLAVGDPVSPGGDLQPVSGSEIGGLTAGTSYTFTVVVSNEAGPGPSSTPTAAVVAPSAAPGRGTPAATPVPSSGGGAPSRAPGASGGSGAPSPPREVTATGVSDGQATVSWKAPSSWGGARRHQYLVIASHDTTNGTGQWTVPATQTDAVVNDLYDDVPVSFTVEAENASGAVSAPSAPSATVVPSPTDQVTNQLTLTAPPVASSSIGSAFTVQQNFYVDQENAGPAAQPLVWAQNVLYFRESSGVWSVSSFTNIWNMASADVYWSVGTQAETLTSYPNTITVTTTVGPDSITFSSSVGGSDYSTWAVPSVGESNPFDVVYDPDQTSTSAGVFWSPETVLVGPGGGRSVAFGSGTAGTLQVAAVLANGSSDAGYECPITYSQSQTGESGANLSWAVQAPLADFQYAEGGTQEGVAFLPQTLACTTPAAPVTTARPATQLFGADGRGLPAPT